MSGDTKIEDKNDRSLSERRSHGFLCCCSVVGRLKGPLAAFVRCAVECVACAFGRPCAELVGIAKRAGGTKLLDALPLPAPPLEPNPEEGGAND